MRVGDLDLSVEKKTKEEFLRYLYASITLDRALTTLDNVMIGTDVRGYMKGTMSTIGKERYKITPRLSRMLAEVESMVGYYDESAKPMIVEIVKRNGLVGSLTTDYMRILGHYYEQLAVLTRIRTIHRLATYQEMLSVYSECEQELRNRPICYVPTLYDPEAIESMKVVALEEPIDSLPRECAVSMLADAIQDMDRSLEALTETNHKKTVIKKIKALKTITIQYQELFKTEE